MKKELKGFLCGVLATSLCAGAVAFAANYEAVTAGFKVLVNGKEFTSDPPALVVEGRTYLPLRAIGDALGVPVNWNDELGQAEVGNSGEIIGLNKIDGNAEVDGITFSQLEITDIGEGYLRCDVNLTNNTGKDLTGVMFKIVFYDDEGNRIFTTGAGAVASTFKNGDTKTVTMPTLSNADLSKATNAKYEFLFDVQ